MLSASLSRPVPLRISSYSEYSIDVNLSPKTKAGNLATNLPGQGSSSER